MSRYKFFAYYWTDDLRWVRLFGYGFYAKPKRMPLNFSERHGYTKLIKIGQWRIGFLRPLKY